MSVESDRRVAACVVAGSDAPPLSGALDEFYGERIAEWRAWEAASRRKLGRPGAIRRFGALAGVYDAPQVDKRNYEIPGPHGLVALRAYVPPELDDSAPGLVWLHGGAFVEGDLDMPEADIVSTELAVRAGVPVVSVGYRLATETVRYPVPLDDILTAWKWAGASGLAERWVLGGASAGGAHAASLTLRLRDEREDAPVGVVLAYPCPYRKLPALPAGLEAIMAPLPAIVRFPQDVVERFYSFYTGPSPVKPSFAVPGELPLDGFPRTLILNAEFDDLRESGDAFARALLAREVPVEVVTEPGVLHGFLNQNPQVLRAADHALAVVANWLRELGD